MNSSQQPGPRQAVKNNTPGTSAQNQCSPTHTARTIKCISVHDDENDVSDNEESVEDINEIDSKN